MLRLKSQQNPEEKEMLAIPGAEPLTLLRVSNEHLPYACQCPLCGGIFEIPQGILYKIEDDQYEDVDSDMQMSGGSARSPRSDFERAVTGPTGESEIAEAPEEEPIAEE